MDRPIELAAGTANTRSLLRVDDRYCLQESSFGDQRCDLPLSCSPRWPPARAARTSRRAPPNRRKRPSQRPSGAGPPLPPPAPPQPRASPPSSHTARTRPTGSIATIKLADNRWRLELRMRRWHTGGDGEAEVLFRDQARELADKQGYRHYVVLSWVQGIESTVPIAQRWARGEIELTGSDAADASGQAVSGAATSPGVLAAAATLRADPSPEPADCGTAAAARTTWRWRAGDWTRPGCRRSAGPWAGRGCPARWEW